MLLDAGVVIGAYIGARLFEYYRKKEQQNLKNRIGKEVNVLKKEILNVQSSKNLESIDASKAEKESDHYLNVSITHLGLATIRQFIYPPIAPLHIGFFIYNNFPLYKRAEKNVFQERKIDNEVLTTVSSFIALIINQYFAIGLGCCLYHFGNKITAKVEDHSKKMLITAFEQLPNKVWTLKNNFEIEISIKEIHVNDIVVANAGDIVPIDGIIIDGIAMIDQHALTGESQPVEKETGDKVLASTIVIKGKIFIKVNKTGNDTTFYKINQILNNSAQFKTKTQLKGKEWADKAVLPFFGMSILTTALFGFHRGVVVLSSSFGNRIGVLAPLGTLNYLKLAYQKGILVKDGCALEGLNKVDTILFDKTGTLTKEQLEVGRIIICDNYGENEVLTYAAVAECKVAHPIAKAIFNKAHESNIILPDIDDSQYQIGYGITVKLKNKLIQVGSVRFMTMEKIVLSEKIEKAIVDSHANGNSIVMISVNHKIIGAIEIQAVVRPEVKKIISDLRQQGIKHIAIVSGDHKQPTQKLAQSLGIESYFYDILPQDKASIVEQLQKEGKSVCFVGDGINDAIAMRKADVSISLTGASSIAIDIAQVILMDGTLFHIAELFEMSKHLEINLRNSLILTTAPTIVNIGGAFWINISFTTAIIVKYVGFLFGLGNAMLPLRRLGNDKIGTT